jgi:hypothetical protein
LPDASASACVANRNTFDDHSPEHFISAFHDIMILPLGFDDLYCLLPATPCRAEQ